MSPGSSEDLLSSEQARLVKFILKKKKKTSEKKEKNKKNSDGKM